MCVSHEYRHRHQYCPHLPPVLYGFPEPRHRLYGFLETKKKSVVGQVLSQGLKPNRNFRDSNYQYETEEHGS